MGVPIISTCRLAVDLETLDVLAGVKENPLFWLFQPGLCPWLDSVPFDELQNVLFL